MRFVFQFVPLRFALLSCVIYLALLAGFVMLAAFINVVVFKNWGFSASRSIWLLLNAGDSSSLRQWLGESCTHTMSDNCRNIAITQVIRRNSPNEDQSKHIGMGKSSVLRGRCGLSLAQRARSKEKRATGGV
jgi:hypothetical protein